MSSTVLHRLADWANTSPHAPAQRYKAKGQWNTLSARDYLDRVFHLTLFLESRGMTAQDTGCILGYNSMEWVHTELALMLGRSKIAGLYPNSTPKDIHYILNHTECSFLAVQNRTYWDKIVAEGRSLPEKISLVLVFDGDTSISPKAVAYSQAIEEGRKLAQGRRVEDFLSKIDPFAPAFMIYTSGTTGNPKGALLSHDNLTYTSDLISKRWKLPFEKASLFSFLPLCHIAEQLHSVGVGISMRYLTNYCSKFENVATELTETEPTLLLCVPRVWEKMMEGVMNKIEKGTGLKKKLAIWALGVGERLATAKFSGKAASSLDLLAHPLADRLVLSKVRKALGLGRANLLASGAAPLPAHVSRWFRKLGLEIYECYGLTESTGVVSVTLPGVECAGTVGKPLEGTEFKLESDGEICSRGRHIFLGYFKDEANTSATLKDGWLHTGDLGAWTDGQLLKIVGRKKEIMKTSGGKMIAPVPIEEKLKEAIFISQVCLVGDNRKYLSALITLSEGTLQELKTRPEAFQNGVLADSTYLKAVEKELARVNQSLATFEQVKRFKVIDREFSIDTGEMTPTLKMKRNVIESRFKDLIDDMYPAGH